MSGGNGGGGFLSYRVLAFILFWLAGFMLQKDIQQHYSFESKLFKPLIHR